MQNRGSRNKNGRAETIPGHFLYRNQKEMEEEAVSGEKISADILKTYPCIDEKETDRLLNREIEKKRVEDCCSG
mgnify:CR=1 FL=1